jgi:hypothetical protein
MDVTGQRPRADRGTGDGGADRKTLRGQHIAQQPHHDGLAAEQMDTAGDIEEQAVRGIARDQWCEAVAPFGNRIQRLRVSGFIGIEYP